MALDVVLAYGLCAAVGLTAVEARAENPFLNQAFYVNPKNSREYDGSIATSSGRVRTRLQEMRKTPSAYWVDTKEKIQGESTSTVEGILHDASRVSPPELVVFIWYNLPNRDCDAKASTGQICCTKNADGTCNYDVETDCAEGLEEYKSEYVDPFITVLKEYEDELPIVIVVEPDSIANLATNVADPHCGNIATRTAYKSGIKYALDQLTKQVPAVSIYLDAAHGGWLGWENSMEKFTQTLKYMDLPLKKIRGFATNVANYQALGIQCPWCPDQGYRNGYCLGGKHRDDPCCDDPCNLLSQYNFGNNELNYAAGLVAAAAGELGMDAHVIIDTGRNGVTGQRSSCANWCNPRGAGAGVRSTAHVANTSLVDAYFWLKTPGESDGCSETLPNGTACPRFDDKCKSVDSLSTKPNEPSAPEAGKWYDFQVKQLAAHARFSAPAGVGFDSSTGAVCPVASNVAAPAATTHKPAAPTKAADSSGAAQDGTGKEDAVRCAGVFEQCGQVVYAVTERVVRSEGLSLADHFDRYYSLEECKSLCDAALQCNSFAYSLGGACHLKDKCINASEPIVPESMFRTYYRTKCPRGDNQWTGATCCEAGCTCESQGGYYSQCMPPNGTNTCAAKISTDSRPAAAQRNPSAAGTWFFASPDGEAASTTTRSTSLKPFLPSPSALPPLFACASAYEQCGGDEVWNGTTCCEPGCTCESRGGILQCIPPDGSYKCPPQEEPGMVIVRKYGRHQGLQGAGARGQGLWRLLPRLVPWAAACGGLACAVAAAALAHRRRAERQLRASRPAQLQGLYARLSAAGSPGRLQPAAASSEHAV